MTGVSRDTGRRLLRVGLPVWLLMFAALVVARLVGYGSWTAALLPLWGPPALVLAYVAWSIALAVVLIVVAIFWRIVATCIGVRP